MENENVTPTGPDKPRSALLQEGAKSYLDALVAVSQFQSDVRERCKNALAHRLADYGSALGTPLDTNTIKDWPPSGKELRGEGDWANLGGQIDHNGCSSYCLLNWKRESEVDTWFGVWLGTWFSRHNDAVAVHKAFNVLQPAVIPGIELELTKNHVALCRRLAPADMAALDSALDEALKTWIGLWRQFGGFKALAPV